MLEGKMGTPFPFWLVTDWRV